MKTTIQSILVAAALVTASASGMAAAENEKVAANNGATSATSVAEMMQGKQERQLRAQLVTDGRWNQVRQLDEDKAMRMREKQENRYRKVNEDLGRSGNVEATDRGALLNECDPDKLRAKKLRSASTDDGKAVLGN